MIERYRREEMTEIFSEDKKFDYFLKVEILAAKAFSKMGHIPEEDIEKLEKNARFDVGRILEIEKETHHDVVAFTRAVSESLGEEKKWVHYGLTSTDVVDTAYAYRFKLANDILEKDLLDFIEVLREKAMQYKDTPCIGRTHGVHAEITSFGLKFALYYDEMMRNLRRFREARVDVETGKLSGAVGSFATTDTFIQDYVCQQLGINSANISTQVIERDNHAYYFSTLALIASSLEKIAMEIRHLQRTEVREVEEYFNKGQKGSSAMPHKRNPIASENICGCARVMRGYMMSSFENMPLWHERDISHSSTERIISADACQLLDYMLTRYSKVLKNLTVFEDNMKKNIYLTGGVIFSQKVMLGLIDKGLSREEAYDLVQPRAIKSWEEKLEFKSLVWEAVKDKMSVEEFEACFDLAAPLKNVDKIYERVGLK